MICFMLGTRAQLVKMAPVLKAVEAIGEDYEVIWTGQHAETIADLLEDFQVEKSFYWISSRSEINSIGKFPLWVASIFIRAFGRDRSRIKRYSVIVTHGDTTSTVIAAVIGKALNIPVAHVESGLRSFHLLSPFPEEINRLITFRLSTVAYCGGEWAAGNMRRFPNAIVFDTEHNTIVDSIRLVGSGCVTENVRPAGKFAVCSIHRFENLFNSNRLESLIDCIELAAAQCEVLFVMHPATRKKLQGNPGLERLEKNGNIQLIDRMGYCSFLSLLMESEFVLTDGGSNQEELFYLGKPTAIMREKSERKEGLGQNAMLVGADLVRMKKFLETRSDLVKDRTAVDHSPSLLIAKDLAKRFKKK